MTHRTHLSRPFILIGLLVSLIFAGGTVVQAGDVEADVISEAFEQFTDTLSQEGATTEDLFVHVGDFVELWSDTPAGSYCEQYAATGVTISFIAAANAADENEAYNLATSIAVGGLSPLVDELRSIGDRCRNER